MKNFFLVAKDDHKDTLAFAEAVISYIEAHGGSCELGFNPDDSVEGELILPENTECILSYGGDGTLIRAAQNSFGKGIPMIGVNGGHLGYLCDLDKNSVYDGIDKLLADDFSIEDRMMLTGLLCDEVGAEFSSAQALNDIVVGSSAGLQVMTITISVNGSYLYSYNCDGMIFSTPTGSTAYNLSANGPIVNPKTNLILLTPINAHTLNARSIVLDPYDEIELEFKPRRKNSSIVAEVSFDGNHKRSLIPGQKLVVRRAEQTTTMIHLEDISFLDRIRTKMQEI